MKRTYCDCCGGKINEEIRDFTFGPAAFVIGIPHYIVDPGVENKECIISYELCWQCQDKVHRAAYEEMKKIRGSKTRTIEFSSEEE